MEDMNKFEDLVNVKFEPGDNDSFKDLRLPLRDYLEAIGGLIRPDPLNRGGSQLLEEAVEDIAENFMFASFGMAHVEQQPDGFYEMKDAHHRTEAVKRRLDRGKFTREDLGQPVVLRVLPYGSGWKVYRALNSQRGHSNRNKLMDPRYYLGLTIRKVLARAKIKVDPARVQVLANMVGVLSLGKENMPWRAAVQAGKTFSYENMNAPAGKDQPIKWSAAMEDRLVRAIGAVEYLLNDIFLVAKRIKVVPRNLRKLSASSPFYSLLLLDALSENQEIMDKYNEDVARKILGNFAEFVEALALMNNADKYLTFTQQMLGLNGRLAKKPKDGAIELLLSSSRYKISHFVGKGEALTVNQEE